MDEALAQEADRANNVKLAAARRERDSAKREIKDLEVENAELRSVVNLFGSIEAADPSPPKWLSPTKPKSSHKATLMLLLSDLHFDEVCKPEELSGLNAYNRAIATLRLEAWAKNVIKLSRHYLSGVTYDGVVLMLGGDTFSGNIHEELQITNEDTVYGSLLYWSEQLSAALDLLLGEFGRAHVLSVPGNHGRRTRKPAAKLRARDNLDWLLAHMVARQFKTDRRATFQVGDEADAIFQVYGRGHLLTHGDQVKGGGGIGGIWPPIKRMQARKAQHHMAIGKPFDVLWLGHWHQLIQTPDMVINGAMKGWDEYAAVSGFKFEVPQQALALVTPEHGITWQAPVFCMDRKKEGW